MDDAVVVAESLDRASSLVALETIVGTRDDLNANEIRAIASSLGHSAYVSHVESNSVAHKFGDDPIAAWRVLVQDGLGDALQLLTTIREHDDLKDASQLDTLIQVAKAAVEREGLDALFQLRAPIFQFESDVEESNIILDAVVDALVRSDPQGTWDYIQEESTRVFARSPEQTGQTDAHGPSQRDQDSMRNVVEELLLKPWVKMDPRTVLERLEQFPPHLQALACERGLVALAETDPVRAIELTKELKHLGSNRWRAVRGTVEQWAAPIRRLFSIGSCHRQMSSMCQYRRKSFLKLSCMNSSSKIRREQFELLCKSPTPIDLKPM